MPPRKIRPLIFGQDGAGKSYFAATFPKPMLVILFDPPDKASEYLNRGVAGEIESGPLCYFQNVFSTTDPEKRIIRVEYWGESNPEHPTSYQRFMARTANFEKEIASEGYETVILDSVTSFELACRYYSKYGINAANADGRAHFNFSMQACEQFIMTRWPNLIRANAIAIAHYDEQKAESEDGETVTTKKMIAVPGKLPNRIGTAWSEVWRVYKETETGQRRLQTQERPRNSFVCKSAMHFVDGGVPHYEALWAGLEKKVETLEKGEEKG